MEGKIVKDIFYSFLDIMIVSITGYLFYMMAGKMLTPSDYGLLMAVIGLYIIVSPFTTLGFHEAITRFIPVLKKQQIKSYVKFVFRVSLFLAIVVGFLFFIFSDFVAIKLYSNESLIRPLQIFPLLLLFGTMTLLAKGILIGLKEFKKVFFIDLIAQPIRLFIPFLLIVGGFGVFGGLLGWSISFLMFFLISTIYIFRILPNGKKEKIEKNIYKYGISSALSISGFWILIQMNIISLSILDLESAGLFGVALVFGQMMLFLPTILGNVILPYISGFFADKLFYKAEKMVGLCLKNLLIFSIPLFLFINLFSKALIRYIYNPQYLGANIFIFPFTLGCLILSLSMIQLITVYASGFPLTKIKIIWFGVFANFIFSLLFYNLIGTSGIVFGFLLTQVLIFILVLIYSYKKVKINLPRKMLNILFPMGTFSFIIYLIERFYINFYFSILFLCFSVLIYFILLYHFKAFDKDDEVLLKMLLGRFGIHKDIYISK